MSTAAYKRKQRALEKLWKAIVWAIACGVKVEDIATMAKIGKAGRLP